MRNKTARLDVTLKDVEPKVTRRVIVRLNTKLDRLHLILQAAMGWTNTHLWEFTARGVGWGPVDPEYFDNPLDASKATLWDVIEDTGAKTLHYMYDMGDAWDHTLKIAAFDDAIPHLGYPFLTNADGRCPPEDCGGPFEYMELLDALKDPSHERHEEAAERLSKDFDPKTAPFEDLAAAVDSFAVRRRPKIKKTA